MGADIGKNKLRADVFCIVLLADYTFRFDEHAIPPDLALLADDGRQFFLATRKFFRRNSPVAITIELN